MSERRCLLVSSFNADHRPWNGVPFEFITTLAGLEQARIMAPQGRRSVCNGEPHSATLRSELALRGARRIGRKLSGRHAGLMRPTEVTGQWDILVFVCQFLEEVQEIEQLEGWREKSQIAVIFLLEGWTSTFPEYRREIALLSKFDHVFVLNGSSVPQLRALVSAPVTQLCTAGDVAAASPPPRPPARAIDLICFGRWHEPDHRRLVSFAAETGLFYCYDVWRGLRATDWDAVRRRNAALILRSRYYLVWEPDAWHQPWRNGRGRDISLSTRYFEGASSGAVLLGSAPAGCPEYEAAFDWADALIPLGDDPEGVVKALDADPLRVMRARMANIRNTLRRHDWAHRWAEMLGHLGLPLTEAHRARLARLDLMAAQIDAPALARKGGRQNLERGTA